MSPTKVVGVRPPSKLDLIGVEAVIFRPGVITWRRRRLALDIQAASLESRASRYSCCVCVSNRPGKKSLAMICDRASVYESSSSTFLGLLIFLTCGGGGISSVSCRLRTKARDELLEASMMCCYWRSMQSVCYSIECCLVKRRRTAGTSLRRSNEDEDDWRHVV